MEKDTTGDRQSKGVPRPRESFSHLSYVIRARENALFARTNAHKRPGKIIFYSRLLLVHERARGIFTVQYLFMDEGREGGKRVREPVGSQINFDIAIK